MDKIRREIIGRGGAGAPRRARLQGMKERIELICIRDIAEGCVKDAALLKAEGKGGKAIW